MLNVLYISELHARFTPDSGPDVGDDGRAAPARIPIILVKEKFGNVKYFAYLCNANKNNRIMILNVEIRETSHGSVRVEVPEGATEEQIYDAAYNAYCEGRAYFGDGEFDTISWQKDE